MLHAIVMAGGSGTRFWPASRAAEPKQLLSLVGDRSMLQQTVERLGDLTTPQRTLILTNRRLVEAVREQLPSLPEESLVGEPCKRDTAPCIGLAALLVSRHDPDATMAVLPADHVIGDEQQFRSALRQADRLLQSDEELIVTFGIQPTYPAEIFGYIQSGSPIETSDDEAPTYRVQQFREKPDAATAAQYLAEGGYYWNSGIFVWKATTILDALRKRQPEMTTRLERIANAWGGADQERILEREFAAIEGISIDYAVMEHAENVAVIVAPYDWDDLGSWQSLSRLRGTDEANNTIIGRHLGLNTQGTIVRTNEQHLVVTVGLKDCLVVHTPNATLVANKNDEEAIREVVKQLEARGWTEYL